MQLYLYGYPLPLHLKPQIKAYPEVAFLPDVMAFKLLSIDRHLPLLAYSNSGEGEGEGTRS